MSSRTDRIEGIVAMVDETNDIQWLHLSIGVDSAGRRVKLIGAASALNPPKMLPNA